MLGDFGCPLGFVLWLDERRGRLVTLLYTLRSFPMDGDERGYAAPIEDEI